MIKVTQPSFLYYLDYAQLDIQHMNVKQILTESTQLIYVTFPVV